MARTIETTRDPADGAAFDAVRAVCRRQANDLCLASAVLPRAKRDAVHAVHAFCRLIRDAFDDESRLDDGTSACCSGSSADQRAQTVRAMLADIYAGRMNLPLPEFRSEGQHVLHAAALTLRRYNIPQAHFIELCEGYRADQSTRRYATWASLETHCRATAGMVAAIASCILGLQHSQAGQSAVRMGSAIRLTSILRDIRSDLDRGRIYLPLADMVRCGYSERDLSRGVVNEKFRELMAFEIERARQLYRESSAGLCWLAGDGSRVFAATIAVVHSGILRAIEARNYDVFVQPITLATSQKLRRLPGAWKLARRLADDPLPHVF